MLNFYDTKKGNMRAILFHSIIWLILCVSTVFAESIDCSETVVLKPYQPPSYADEKWDGYCSRLFLQKYAPHGFMVIFGANRQNPVYPEDYQLIYEFAKKWSADSASLAFPLATGGGGGIMRAATLGARDGRQNAKVLSLDVNIYTSPLNLSVEKADPEDIPRYTFVYRSMAKREADLIDYAQGVVISLGGIGTEWEFLEALVKIHLQKKAPVPIIILSKNVAEYTRMIRFLINKNLVIKQICQYVNIADSADSAMVLLKAPKLVRQSDPSNLCFSLMVPMSKRVNS